MAMATATKFAMADTMVALMGGARSSFSAKRRICRKRPCRNLTLERIFHMVPLAIKDKGPYEKHNGLHILCLSMVAIDY